MRAEEVAGAAGEASALRLVGPLVALAASDSALRLSLYAIASSCLTTLEQANVLMSTPAATFFATWSLIQKYVTFSPSLSFVLGSQPSTCLMRELSELRPRTPSG